MSSPGSPDLKVPLSHALMRVPPGVRLERTQMVGLALYHALALLAFLPWFFSWTGVLLAVLGIYVFGVLGINIGYHRLLTHKGFVCPKWLERSFAFLGVCCLQGSPSRWVATHRRHHEHADDEPDPHSPVLGFLWAHIGWVLVKNETMERDGLYRNYAKDILRDDFYAWIEDRKMWIWLVLMSWGIFFFGGLAAGLLLGWPLAQAAQFGLSLGYGARSCAPSCIAILPGRSIRSRICGAIAITTRPTIAATMRLSPSSVMARAGTIIIMPIPIRRDTATNGGRLTWPGSPSGS